MVGCVMPIMVRYFCTLLFQNHTLTVTANICLTLFVYGLNVWKHNATPWWPRYDEGESPPLSRKALINVVVFSCVFLFNHATVWKSALSSVFTVQTYCIERPLSCLCLLSCFSSLSPSLVLQDTGKGVCLHSSLKPEYVLKYHGLREKEERLGVLVLP